MYSKQAERAYGDKRLMSLMTRPPRKLLESWLGPVKIGGEFSVAKRVANLAAGRFILDYLVRHALTLGKENEKRMGMGLAGESPLHAALVPAALGLINGMDLYESDSIKAATAKAALIQSLDQLRSISPMAWGRTFNHLRVERVDFTSARPDKRVGYCYFDFDFCHNPFNHEGEARGVIRFVNENMDRRGELIALTITSHRGFHSSPVELLRAQVQVFEKYLEGIGALIEAKTSYPYSQDINIPMTLFVWILRVVGPQAKNPVQIIELLSRKSSDAAKKAWETRRRMKGEAK